MARKTSSPKLVGIQKNTNTWLILMIEKNVWGDRRSSFINQKSWDHSDQRQNTELHFKITGKFSKTSTDPNPKVEECPRVSMPGHLNLITQAKRAMRSASIFLNMFLNQVLKIWRSNIFSRKRRWRLGSNLFNTLLMFLKTYSCR